LKDPSELENFVVELSKLTRSGVPLIYFDEASFNLWLRIRRTWCSVDEPVKMMLNKGRGNGITVMGAISKQLFKPIFTIEKATNTDAFILFLQKLRARFQYTSDTLHLVLDNHRAHHALTAKAEAARLRIQLHFMPPYTPELNSIESLWSVIKRDFKRRMFDNREVNVTQAQFAKVLQESLDAVTPSVQQNAARYNNRKFLHRILQRLVKKQADFVAEEPGAGEEIDSVSDDMED
jgi:transposase